ncbi:MAG: rhomboid family intramembrane serine protease [Pseudomonadota bacterium]
MNATPSGPNPDPSDRQLAPDDDRADSWDGFEPPREPTPAPPIFNLPGIIVVLVAAFIVMHVLRTHILEREGQVEVLVWLSFIPATVTQTIPGFPSNWVALWTPVTHAFLHGDWLHLGVNALWLVAFGSAVAKRIGTVGFLIFFALGSAFGALAHFITHVDAVIPVIGASGAVSACMGAAVRFAFSGRGVTNSPETARRLSLVESFRNPTVLGFVGIWFALNWLFGSGVIPIPGAEGQIAWQAHVGGFLFGLLAFSLFDRRSHA